MRGLMLILGISCILCLPGCARTGKVVAREGDTEIPYQSLGTLEVKLRAPVTTPSRVFFGSVELLTLGFAKTPSRGDTYKEMLRDKLAKEARQHYRADEVIPGMKGNRSDHLNLQI